MGEPLYHHHKHHHLNIKVYHSKRRGKGVESNKILAPLCLNEGAVGISPMTEKQLGIYGVFAAWFVPKTSNNHFKLALCALLAKRSFDFIMCSVLDVTSQYNSILTLTQN